MYELLGISATFGQINFLWRLMSCSRFENFLSSGNWFAFIRISLPFRSLIFHFL